MELNTKKIEQKEIKDLIRQNVTRFLYGIAKAVSTKILVEIIIVILKYFRRLQNDKLIEY